jgi:hypothetical protein
MPRTFCYDEAMRKTLRLSLLACWCLLLPAGRSFAQGNTGTLDISAHIAPTGAQPEPVRQFTFYVLTRSYADVCKEIAAQFPLADRDTFVSELKISPELKEWLKRKDVIDLSAPETDKLISPDDVMDVPEFFSAYLRSNGGGVTKGLPVPKYKDSDKESNPAKYEKMQQDYLTSLRKFVTANPTTIVGMETELGGVNPKYKWDRALLGHNQKVAQLAPQLAQTKYLAGKGDTDLDGRLVFNGVPPGNYWVTTLGVEATAGDRRLLWDVPVSVQAGKAAHLELSNVNGTGLNANRP